MGRAKSNAAMEPISIRISPEVMKLVRFAAPLLKLSEHDTLRLAMEVGLEDLKRIKYKVPEAIVQTKERAKFVAASTLVEEPVEYAAMPPEAAAGGNRRPAHEVISAIQHQTEANKKLIEQSAEPAPLRLLPGESESGAESQSAKRKQAR